MNIENLEIMENLISCMCENKIDATDVASIGYEDHDFFILLKSGESVSFSCERTR